MAYFTHVNDLNVICYLSADFIISAIHLIAEPCQFLSFVAMKGTQVDGHKFIPKAIELGAKSIFCEDLPQEPVEGVTYIQVASTEDAVGKAATIFLAFSPLWKGVSENSTRITNAFGLPLCGKYSLWQEGHRSRG